MAFSAKGRRLHLEAMYAVETYFLIFEDYDVNVQSLTLHNDRFHSWIQNNTR